MNDKAKKRLTIVGLVIVIVVIAMIAVLGAGGASQALTVAEAASGEHEGKKVQVSGKIVDDSTVAEGSSLAFDIVGEEGQADTTTQLHVVYEGAVPATFGNGIVAIATGSMQENTLYANQLVTKCPSKYESAEGALTVTSLLTQKAAMVGKETKLAGYVVNGSLTSIDKEGPRFVIDSQGETMGVHYDGALSDEVTDGTAVVLTGALQEDETFLATDVAIDEAL